MSMYDKSYCNTVCDQTDCERNIRYNKPQMRYYSVATFDNTNIEHKDCIWKVKKGSILNQDKEV